jgi:hypothetical protein
MVPEKNITLSLTSKISLVKVNFDVGISFHPKHCGIFVDTSSLLACKCLTQDYLSNISCFGQRSVLLNHEGLENICV